MIRVSLTGSVIDASVLEKDNGTGGLNWSKFKAGNAFVDRWTEFDTEYLYVFAEDSTGSSNEAIKISIGDNSGIRSSDFIFELTGTSGDDVLTGSYGDDIIVGGAGNDIITGGKGADTLTGGEGADTFVFNDGYSVAPTAVDVSESIIAFGDGVDVVTDFSAGADEFQDVMRFVNAEGAERDYGNEDVRNFGKLEVGSSNGTLSLTKATGDAVVEDIFFAVGSWNGTLFTIGEGNDYAFVQYDGAVDGDIHVTGLQNFVIHDNGSVIG